MRILITGSRTWEDVLTIKEAIAAFVLEYEVAKDEAVIVHGDCPRGADAIAKAIAIQWDITHEPHKANWDQHGKPAGFIRNKEMVDLGAAVCLAFIRDNSKGASHTVNLAQQAGIPTRIFRS